MKKILTWLLIAVFLIFLSGIAEALELVRQKNIATYITFPIVDADGDIVTGATTPDSEIDTFSDSAAPDGFTDCTNEATEIGTTGIYYLSLAQAEMNADYIYIQVKTATSGAKTQHILIRTMVGDPLNVATTDDGGTINVTTGKIDEVSTLTGHTAQTGDTYAIVNNGTYGNSALNTAIGTRSTLTAAQVWETNISAYSGAGYAGTYLKGIFDKLPAGTIGTSTYAGGAVASVSGSVGSISGVTFPTNFSSLAITAGGAVTAGTVSDKTGYALTQAFPSNFSSLLISVLGKVTVGTNDDKTGYSLASSQTFNMTGDITGNLSGSVGSVTNGVTVTTNNDKTGYRLSATGVDDMWDEVQTGHAVANSFGKYLDAQVSQVGGGTAADIADAVWDEALSGHVTAGTTGKKLNESPTPYDVGP